MRYGVKKTFCGVNFIWGDRDKKKTRQTVDKNRTKTRQRQDKT